MLSVIQARAESWAAMESGAASVVARSTLAFVSLYFENVIFLSVIKTIIKECFVCGCQVRFVGFFFDQSSFIHLVQVLVGLVKDAHLWQTKMSIHS